MSESSSLQDNQHEPSISVQVHGTPVNEAAKTVSGMYAQIRNAKKHPEMEVVRSHLTRIAKIANNDKLTVQTRIAKLTDLGKLYSDGFPFKNNPKLNALRVDNIPILSRQAHAAADQLMSIEKARYGKDVGRMGNQE